jgi:hypothetical protein
LDIFNNLVRCLYQTWNMSVMYMWVRGIAFPSFYDCSIALWNCSRQFFLNMFFILSIHFHNWKSHKKISLYGLTLPHLGPVPSQELDFQRHMLWYFFCFVSSVRMGGDCSIYCYWWNWSPSLVKLSCHNLGMELFLL